MIKVSVIIPAYQSENYITRCLNSLVNQTLKEIEIIVINDGSTDSTQRIIDEFDIHYPQIKTFKQENLGISTAKKRGLDLAKGNYILFVDHDDVLDLNALEILYKIATQSKADIILYNAYQVIGNEKKEMWAYDCGSEEEIRKDALGIYLNSHIRAPLWCKLLKKSYLIENNISFPKNIIHCEDTATTASILMHQPNIICCDEFLYYWFDYSNSTSHSQTTRIADFTKALEFVTEELVKNNLFSTYKEQLLTFSKSLISWGYQMLLLHPELQHQLLEFYHQWYEKYIE